MKAGLYGHFANCKCACGRLRVNLVGEPVRVGICNCTQCQRRTGGAFAVGAFFPNSQISAIEGAHKAFNRSSDAGRKMEYHFCTECEDHVVALGGSYLTRCAMQVAERSGGARRFHGQYSIPACVPSPAATLVVSATACSIGGRPKPRASDGKT
jgi:hypothetical protein